MTNQPLVCHAFNADCSQMAVSANSHLITIYEIPTQPIPAHKYKILDELSEHTAAVTGLDWAPKSNRIVSSAADRNSYVWTRQNDGKWKPTLVVLQINRAAICVRWSPFENKFAVGSGARSIAICYFEQEHNWWVSKHIKKPIRSTVTSLDWHPNNALIACGSSDFKTRIFSAAAKAAGDEKPGETPWGTDYKFGNLLYEAGCGGGGWVHSVSFSSDGNRLAWSGHDSSITIADASSGTPVVRSLRHSFLPFTSLEWVGRNSLLCVGHDYYPILFTVNNNGLDFTAALDTNLSDNIGGAGEKPASSTQNAFRKFIGNDRFKESTNVSADATITSVHQNTINELRILKGNKSNAQQVSTIGRDGLLVLWDLQTLSQKVSGLRIS